MNNQGRDKQDNSMNAPTQVEQGRPRKQRKKLIKGKKADRNGGDAKGKDAKRTRL